VLLEYCQVSPGITRYYQAIKIFNHQYSGLLNASELKPQFRWLSERSSSGIQHLAIQFGDEERHAVLHPYNPLSFEVKSEVDPCIFKGNLLQEPTTEVLVTGGCPGANSFEVTFFKLKELIPNEITQQCFIKLV